MFNNALLVQLPIPQLTFGMKTGNIPLAAACLKFADGEANAERIQILPESLASYLSDAALIDWIRAQKPDIIGFSIFNWNVDRSLHFARILKADYNPYIVFGGPEITLDNPRVVSDAVDRLVHGPGEGAFHALLQKLQGRSDAFTDVQAVEWSDSIFCSASSPYLHGVLEPEIDNMMYLESQRGCPFRCGFCYYRKSRIQTIFTDDAAILEAVKWALTRQIGEVCFLDPSLNSRPGLKPLLKKITDLNPRRKLDLNAEIRAEMIDAEMADLFADAGFTGFEIGLQSTNPAALRIMGRKTDLNRFLNGVKLLKERNMLPRIDLIAGLPGDTPEGFRESVQFIIRHELYDDVQIFPLSILPGTHFHRRSRELGIVHEKDPPYSVLRTQSFSAEAILDSLKEAEHMLDMSLFPPPHIHFSLYQTSRSLDPAVDHTVRIGDETFICRLMMMRKRSSQEIAQAASKLTHPYQIIFHPAFGDSFEAATVVTQTTRANPHTPLELIFIEPRHPLRTDVILAAAHLARPHYLDNDLRYLYKNLGNRAILFTILSTRRKNCFNGSMIRQIFWWREARLPEQSDLEALDQLDGVLIDSPCPPEDVRQWQSRMSGIAEDLRPICFAETIHQKHWLSLTLADACYFGVFP